MFDIDNLISGDVNPLVLGVIINVISFLLGFVASRAFFFVQTVARERKHHVSGTYIMKYDRPAGDSSRHVHLFLRNGL